jgi:D-glycero-D-manno-heptose 1,7-bisphosphate phosphatase
MSHEPSVPTGSGRARTRWVFLDRDGTLNRKPAPGDYVRRARQLQLLPGAAEGVGLLNRSGCWVGVVTNQRGVALGRMSGEDLVAVHERLVALLAEQGARLDAIYACPHDEGQCDCRKPRPGMLLIARREHPALDLSRAAIVGDSLSDMQAGRRAGVATVLVGEGDRDAAAVALADHVVADLLAAARLLAAQAVSPSGD